MAMVAVFNRRCDIQGKTYPPGARVPDGLMTPVKVATLTRIHWIEIIDEDSVTEWPEPTEIGLRPTPSLRRYLEASARFDEADQEAAAARNDLILAQAGMTEEELRIAATLDPGFEARQAAMETVSVEIDGQAVVATSIVTERNTLPPENDAKDPAPAWGGWNPQPTDVVTETPEPVREAGAVAPPAED